MDANEAFQEAQEAVKVAYLTWVRETPTKPDTDDENTRTVTFQIFGQGFVAGMAYGIAFKSKLEPK